MQQLIKDSPISALQPQIDIIGNQRVMIEGSRGVLFYDENRVELNLGKFKLLIVGSGLQMSDVIGGDAVVTGLISSIEFL